MVSVLGSECDFTYTSNNARALQREKMLLASPSFASVMPSLRHPHSLTTSLWSLSHPRPNLVYSHPRLLNLTVVYPPLLFVQPRLSHTCRSYRPRVTLTSPTVVHPSTVSSPYGPSLDTFRPGCDSCRAHTTLTSSAIVYTSQSLPLFASTSHSLVVSSFPSPQPHSLSPHNLVVLSSAPPRPHYHACFTLTLSTVVHPGFAFPGRIVIPDVPHAYNFINQWHMTHQWHAC
jgi:hypothetical protein